MNYPGDTADPVDVARWMSSVAEEEYALPGILPVMTSCVELTSAWTGPGDVKTVPGFLYAQDHDSLGYFQQRPSQGWGSPEECSDPDHSLRAFCKAAKAVEDDSPADTPEQLGAWCQSVQRSAYPERYAEIGYPMAKELLDSAGESSSDYGWYGWESATSWNLVYHTPDVQEDGGLWQKYGWYGWEPDTSWNLIYREASEEIAKPDDGFSWPEANEESDPTSYVYQKRHPTRYFWRPDVESWARYLVDNYNVWCNTYLEHPEGYGYNVASTGQDGTVWYVQNTSMDVWGPGGRNDPIDPALGGEIFSLLFNDPNFPNINWIIWQETIYGAWNGWNGEYFGDGSDFTAHRDHIHVTYE